MAERRKRNTRQEILEAVRDLVGIGGPAMITFDAVAERLELSKQAIIYWFPTKEDLIASAALPALRQEAEHAIAAVDEAPDAAAAIERFVRAVAEFHLSDLERFRLMYISPQSGAKSGRRAVPARVSERIHPVTARMYAALEARLVDSPVADRTDPRRTAVSIHMAVLGLILMVALADAVNDPLRHAPEDMIESLVAMATAAGAP